ncbi:MAG: glycosyltransferase [Nitrososphaeria archaeon]
MNRLQGASVVSVYPPNSGVGTYARRLFNLGLYEELVMFRISGPELGYDRVIKYRFNPNGLMSFLSIYIKSRWSSYSSERSLIHITSPDYFHMIKFNPKTYGTVHDIFALQSRDLFYRKYFMKEMSFAERLAGIVVPSRFTQKALEDRFPHLRTTVIHNWTGSEFHPRDMEESRKRLNLPVDKKIVLSVGSDIPRKNLTIIPQIVERLGKDFMLIRLGSFSFFNGGDGFKVREMIETKRVAVIRDVPEELIPLYYNAANVLIAPSLEEGFDYPVIEAINSNIPVVASDIEVHREVMMNRGHFADPRDPDEWVGEIAKAVDEKNPWDGFGDHYREERAIQEYLKFYGIG